MVKIKYQTFQFVPQRVLIPLVHNRPPLRKEGARTIVAALAGLMIGGLALVQPAPVRAQMIDPGVRGGAPGAGGPLANLGSADLAFFNAARDIFREVDSVSGTIPNEPGRGLGPRFNLNSCAGCHAQPAVGGSSLRVNPQFAVATLDGAKNSVPSFLSTSGPVRVARIVRKPDGTPDGGVAPLFTIAGRTDASGCTLKQPNFAQHLAANNLAFRIPTPVFGAGLIEAIPDDNLLAAFAANASQRAALGIAGRFNRNGNDGTITRFGWKAQNKSLLLFSGEAYNVEQGVTNDLFPNENDTTAGCQFNATPEDTSHTSAPSGSPSLVSALSSDLVNFAMFMRLTAPPQPAISTPAIAAGRQVFMNTGCSACHIPAQRTAASSYVGMAQTQIEPFSDFALHDMGDGLADSVSQGLANGREFRTAPLWGLGQRLFFLHDGRASSIVDAVRAHAGAGSEANAVIARFNALSGTDARNLLAFLRAL